MTANHLPEPALVAGLERLARTELSLGARLVHVALALVASAMTIVVVSLLLTEPALPLRTIVAFGLLGLIGVGWVAYSAWVLTARRVMLARQRVVAGRLAVVFCGTFTGGCVVLAFTTGAPAAWPAMAMSVVMLAHALAARRDGARKAARPARGARAGSGAWWHLTSFRDPIHSLLAGVVKRTGRVDWHKETTHANVRCSGN
jgi:hypothetical protein